MLNLLFSNEHFCAVYKPANWLSVPSRMGVEDSRPVLGISLQEQLGVKIWPCHRLDYEVSGVVLFALNSKAHAKASSWFESKTIRKTYHALAPIRADAVPDYNVELRWHSLLARGKKRAYEASFGKPSETAAIPKQVCGATQDRILWHLNPLTGRSHQLRYEMAKHGYPILGDSLYGSTFDYEDGGIALRAVELDFNAASDRVSFGLPEMIRIPNEFSLCTI